MKIMKNKAIWIGGIVAVVIIIILISISINLGFWLRENPDKYKEAISEFVDVPSNAKYNVVRHGPYDVKPYTDFIFIFWWNKGEWYYRATGETKPNSNDVKEIEIRVFKLKPNAVSIFDEYGVLAFEGDFSTRELEFFQRSRHFIHSKYWLNKGPGPIHSGNSFLPNLDIQTTEEAKSYIKDLTKFEQLTLIRAPIMLPMIKPYNSYSITDEEDCYTDGGSLNEEDIKEGYELTSRNKFCIKIKVVLYENGTALIDMDNDGTFESVQYFDKKPSIEEIREYFGGGGTSMTNSHQQDWKFEVFNETFIKVLPYDGSIYLKN